MAESIVIVDGENLVIRYQEMLSKKGKRTLQGQVIHEPDVFVWSKLLINSFPFPPLRINYFASAVGDDETIIRRRNQIAEIQYAYRNDPAKHQLCPRVFKKPKKETRSRHIDIALTIDALRHAVQPHIKTIVILSGDGDFVPVIEEIMRGGKRVYVAAFSDGFNNEIARCVDNFRYLDEFFFQP